MKNRLLTALIFFTISTSASALPFAKGNADAGKQSFDQHKCNACHAGKVGGDGSSIFTRPEHKVKTAASLATQITTCSINLGLMLFEEDEENLGAYLNKKYYKFK